MDMGTVELRLNDYIWDNLNELKSLFSDKVYKSLLKKREVEDREGFTDTLELIVDLDSDFFDNINSEYSNNLPLDEIIALLDISPYDNFVDKKIYVNRAEYWITNYKNEDAKYALLLNNLGRVYNFLGEYEKAELLYEKALKIREELLGEKHSDTARSYNNLANVYHLKGEYEKAELLYEKALKISEEVLGEKHPDTASSYNNLASLYDSKGEYEKAEPLFEKALKIREEVLGEKHPDTATSYGNLGLLYRDKKLCRKAKEFLEKCIEVVKTLDYFEISLLDIRRELKGVNDSLKKQKKAKFKDKGRYCKE